MADPTDTEVQKIVRDALGSMFRDLRDDMVSDPVAQRFADANGIPIKGAYWKDGKLCGNHKGKWVEVSIRVDALDPELEIGDG